MNKYILKSELSRPKIKVDFLKQHMLKKNFSAYQRKKHKGIFQVPSSSNHKAEPCFQKSTLVRQRLLQIFHISPFSPETPSN